MRASRILLAAPAAAILLLTTPVAARASESVHVRLLELNRSQATGTATLTALDNGDLRVRIRAAGLVPNSPHAQHLHGSSDSMNFHCPPMSADADADGYLTTEEGLPSYGDIFISLTTRGDSSRASGLAVDRMPAADKNGDLAYDRTIAAADLPPGTITHLKDLHIVQHGIDVNGNGKYDLGGRGESTFAAAAGLDGIPQEATDPALCGMVTGAAAGSVPVGGVATGDGSAREDRNTWIGYGGLAALATLAVLVVTRRRAFTLPGPPSARRTGR
ncbi:hypothetical protein [Actinoplanes sp. DH11]|uniref:hypothetical protein n=1 Tax=Actinoplanes sp. DH11 TaxID=2857011 RepID=UPI001E4E91DF|nr:hypothetical protein [Actinoplanes sp. DH11]